MIRVILPAHLRTLSKTGQEVQLEPEAPNIESVINALEAAYPSLSGTLRDHGTQQRRAFVRFFVCGEDWSHEPLTAPLPQAIADGAEPLLIVGAIAGGGLPGGNQVS